MAVNVCQVLDESLNNILNEKSNVESENLMTSTLLDLNDFALLRVFSYLNLRDCINFAETCVRLSKVSEIHFTKYKRFDLLKFEHFEYLLDNYYDRYAYYDDDVDDNQDEDENEEEIEEPEPIPVEKVLAHIGRHIKTLSINSLLSTEKAVMDNCVNVTSLKLYAGYDFEMTSEWKAWMGKLNLESITFKDCSNFNKLSVVGLAALKELKLTDGNGKLTSMELFNILEKTSDLESLEVELYYTDFKYEIFSKLPKLRCLAIKIESKDLVILAEFLKMDVLTKFKLFIPLYFDAIHLKNVNSFLEILAEKGNLNELQLYLGQADENTYRILKLFHLTSLRFYALISVDHCCNDCCMIHQLVDAQRNLLHLDYFNKYLTTEQLVFTIKNLVKLETLTCRMDKEDLEQLNELKIDEILKTSISRPMLTLNINSEERNSVKITVRL